jgi:hypothetical protein
LIRRLVAQRSGEIKDFAVFSNGCESRGESSLREFFDDAPGQHGLRGELGRRISRPSVNTGSA